MKIKKDDNVLIIKGKDRGKTGKILKVYKKNDKVLVDKVNMVKKHVRPRQQNQKGQRVEMEMPLSVSNVKLVCPKCNKPVRVGYKVLEEKKKKDSKEKDKPASAPNKSGLRRGKIRICKKCQQEI